MFCLSETFQTNPNIIAASDRSVSSSVGAYGWACSLPHGQRLATNHGPIFGHFPSSFHAEANGLLSYLRFLYQVSQYTQSPMPKQNIIYTDSTSLTAKLSEIRKWPYFFPNTTMDPDLDVLQQIIVSLCLFPWFPEISFIQGHQDDDHLVEFWGLPPLNLFFNMSTGWFGRFVLSTECYRTRKLDYNDLNWPRCSARVTESLALTDGGFCQKQTLYILDYVKLVSL